MTKKASKLTGKKIPGRITIRDMIRIRKSEIIGRLYPKQFPHLVVLTKEEESEYGYNGVPERIKKIHFERIAVTEQQILQYNLPEMPKDPKTLAKLRRDS